jgi:hypothetical protein
MLSPQEQAIDRIFIEGWNLALYFVEQHILQGFKADPNGTIAVADVLYAINEERS